MNHCSFCHQPCGQREFCDETCKQEYDDEMAIIQESIREDGISQFYVDDEYSTWDAEGGL